MSKRRTPEQIASILVQMMNGRRNGEKELNILIPVDPDRVIGPLVFEDYTPADKTDASRGFPLYEVNEALHCLSVIANEEGRDPIRYEVVIKPEKFNGEVRPSYIVKESISPEMEGYGMVIGFDVLHSLISLGLDNSGQQVCKTHSNVIYNPIRGETQCGLCSAAKK